MILELIDISKTNDIYQLLQLVVCIILELVEQTKLVT